MVSAANQWNSIKSTSNSDMVIFNITTDNPLTRNTVGFGYVMGGALAQTTFNPQTGYINYFTTIVNNQSDNYGNAYSWTVGASYGKYDLYSVVLHELGHALGVAHCHEDLEATGNVSCFSSTCDQNVMTPLISSNMIRRTFQEYDTASYKIIYS